MVFLTRVVRTFWRTETFKKWNFKMQGYNKFGFYRDDLWMTEFPEYDEALRRLPPQLFDEYNFRNVRACQLDLNKEYLPEDQRPTYEEDITKGRFLTPYLEEVFAEKREKEEWDKFMAK